ncbi:MAG: hypothetical protein EPN39_04305 [Chitinophagaceae bacterium]|nr:MAG: hypothetical protein EPN39_04305 [Chitinophagaceae bacterium]
MMNNCAACTAFFLFGKQPHCNAETGESFLKKNTLTHNIPPKAPLAREEDFFSKTEWLDFRMAAQCNIFDDVRRWPSTDKKSEQKLWNDIWQKISQAIKQQS